MLIRVLGKESDALSGNWSHPLTDVSPWADKYVGYAYQKGLAKGVSDTQFGSGNATAATYLTFVLRSLGYTDANSADFTWDNPYALAQSLNLMPCSVEVNAFLRADVVLISYSALSVKIKGTNQSLANKLISDGVFTQQQYAIYYDADAMNSSSNKTALSAEEIYAKCSPAVFYIEVYDKDSKLLATGSGFFIDNLGTAVTNYHVIKGAASAKIKIADTGTVYNVLGVYDCNKEQDWAVLKIDGSGFSYLKRANTSTIIGGATVYAIGSPLGLESTITQGLISNANRTEGSITYIQTSAAISPGSSGGALIDKYGEVIGITSASYVEGQNLNLVLPMTYLANINTSSVKTLAEVNGITVTTTPTTSPIYISVPEANVSLNTGYTKTINVTWIGGNDDDEIYWKSSNENVATASWGNWVGDDTLQLNIFGESPGTATITVFVDSKHKCDISVTVGTVNTYDLIRETVISKGSFVGSGGYMLSYTAGDTKYYLYCSSEDENKIYVSSEKQCTGYTIDTKIDLVGDSVYYRVMANKQPFTFWDGNIVKKSFTSFTTISPTKTSSGDLSVTFGKLCNTSLCQLLAGTSGLFIKYKIPVTIQDLGFDAYYQEMS